jgi:hypothetical protein
MTTSVDAWSEPETRHSALARLVFGFDHWLRRIQNVFEYSQSPQCVFRAQLGRAEHSYIFGNGQRLRAGERIITLHLWNEQVPFLSRYSKTLEWALRMQRSVIFSLRELAHFFASQPQLDDVAAVRLIVTIAGSERTDQVSRVFERLGFQVAPAETDASHHSIRRLAENVYITLLVLSRNPAAVRHDTLRRRRVNVFLLRDDFIRRYGDRSWLSKSPEQQLHQ